MPSKNGFNKPTQGIQRSRKAVSGIRKSASKNYQSFQPPATSAKLFTMEKINKQSMVTNKRLNLTTQTLSKKKARKIERNLRHLEKNGIKSVVLNEFKKVKEGEMEVEEQKSVGVRDALWAVVEDVQSGGVVIDQMGEGTTLGYAGFY